MKKEFGKCPKRLQNMLTRLQAYDATVLYHPGKKMFLADTLSRVYIYGVKQEWVDDEDDVKEAEYIPVTERRLLELRSATKEDRSMQQLQVIVEGWPEDKVHLDPEVRPYFSMRNEMTVQDVDSANKFWDSNACECIVTARDNEGRQKAG